jgi:peptidylprolyl isomerase
MPLSFTLNTVISGWSEGLQLMSVGDKYRLWIPENLAFQGRAGAPPGMLVFDVELLSIENPMTPSQNTASVPTDAKTTTSGLAYKILSMKEGASKPKLSDKVTVHYTGWTSDGKIFDSSVQRGKPETFPLNQVIPGWQEGIQLIGVGGKIFLWVPESLSYRGLNGAPAGLLSFEIELLEIVK